MPIIMYAISIIFLLFGIFDLKSLLGCVLFAIIFFSLGRLFDNQRLIMSKLDIKKEEISPEKKNGPGYKTCPKCDVSYDANCSSCPFCGFNG